MLTFFYFILFFPSVRTSIIIHEASEGGPKSNLKLNDEAKINKIVGPTTKRKKENEKHNKTNKIVGGEQTSKRNAMLQS